jgi:plasmid stabilization system protein ParE
MARRPFGMKPFVLTDRALSDLRSIWKFIASDNPTAADALEDEILNACARIAERPDLGHYRRDITDEPVLFVAVRRRYLIVYDRRVVPLQIVRVLHGSRNIPDLI